ncbi:MULTISPECIES: Gfo/Idh/MocA family protein [Caldilinea]|jgi:predicted dehydrogenase|uniref:Putative oxidoreductase n=1 Tax=Caldilinea aerophila (strain DSM 14535 / JCM 11387 / NBRC 104270 / STL-6-O1) TaxID=926550 RepID=I0HZN4_CALAS|nr:MULTISPECIES: Gfo/Idh/MocA family oxidoreductase [Caldilinea]MBO9394022.1 Gfo/Idh/MocA family oxidoreductase [Caldilinea sp.]BAL98471.1 putative oxidoreductase [Caldilinea aerophila DSM 14535 = NBRC 104270]GIV74947.1 MAG: 1,5-anhydro-D-fructose reductase [Caldilinea sp.]
MADAPSPTLTLRKLDERSVGFLIAGASHVAARWMIPAIQGQPPAVGASDVMGAYVAGIYSHNLRLAQRFAASHGLVHADDNLAALLERRDVHCVYVGNHPRHHAETVRAALAAGKHVLCEPPLSDDLDESRELEQLAHHRSVILAVNYTWRATGAVRRLRELLSEDAIGAPLGVRIDNTALLPLDQHSWRLNPPFGGVLWDRLLHDIDLLAYLLLNDPVEIQTHLLQKLLGGESEEETLSVVRLRGGTPAILHDSFLLPHAPTRVILYGETGSLIASSCRPGDRENRLALQRGEQIHPLTVDPIDPYRASVARFLAAVRLGETPLATPVDDRRAVASVLAAYQSLQNKKPSGLATFR